MKKAIIFLTMTGLLALYSQAKERSAALHRSSDQNFEDAITSRVSDDLKVTVADPYGLSSENDLRTEEMFQNLQSDEDENNETKQDHLVYEVTDPQLARHAVSANKALAENDLDNVKE